jgi:hypothetical protein
VAEKHFYPEDKAEVCMSEIKAIKGYVPGSIGRKGGITRI